MSNNPLYSANGVPLYGKLGRPIYGDFVFSPSYIYIGAQMPIEPADDYGGYTFCNAVGYNYTRGIHYSYPPWVGPEKDSMISYSTPVTRGESGFYTSTKWWWYRFDFDAMVANGFGLGNDGVNDYYEIFCRASINLDNTSFPRDPTYVYFKAWKDTQSISASPILMSVIDINGRRASETPLASVRWTPATSTFEFIYL